MKHTASALLAALLIGLAAAAAPVPHAAPAAAASQTAIGPVVTSHALELPGREIAYRAVVESIPVEAEDDDAAAEVVVTAYLAEGEDARTRPVTFAFNGGPGASSAYLHIGAMGPRVLTTAPDGAMLPPPARLEDNPDSWLAFTDLVFVDPVGTGFSRARGGGEAERAFWGISADTHSLAQVVRMWLTRHDRWASPKFLVGESYGGYRAVQLARTLLDRDGIAFNGLVLISPALEFSTNTPRNETLLPWALALPSMVASARAHGRGDPAPDLDEVERFALSEYLAGIAAIEPAGPGPAPELIARLAELLGLDEDLVRRYRGRVPAWVFAERLHERSGHALSVYDGAQSGPDPRPGRGGGPDPVLDGLNAPLSTAYNAYVRDELNLRTDLEFRLLDPRPSRHWDWEGARGGPGRHDGAMDELAETLALTPDLGVLAVHGRTDLVTPYMTTRWLLDRLDLPAEVRDRVRLEVLDGGHMMYFHPERRKALAALAAEFYGKRPPRPAFRAGVRPTAAFRPSDAGTN